MKKVLIIVNPCSGKAKMHTQLLKVVEVFSNADYEITVYPTKDRGDGTVKAASLKEGLYDLIVVCGGDGTLNEVLTGLKQAGINYPLGYIPAGTLNEWSSSLGIARKIVNAAEDIITGVPITLDIGKFGDKYFSYTASFGAFTSASYDTPQSIKNMLGQTAYFLGGIKSLASIKSTHLKFIADGKEYEGDYLFGGIANSMSLGGVVKFQKASVDLNDGFFEVLLIKKPSNILKLQPLIDGILKRKFDHEGFDFFHAKEIKVIAENNVPWTLDGEYAEAETEFTVTNIHNGLNLIVPRKYVESKEVKE